MYIRTFKNRHVLLMENMSTLFDNILSYDFFYHIHIFFTWSLLIFYFTVISLDYFYIFTCYVCLETMKKLSKPL